MADFGVAVVSQGSRHKEVVGTLEYMAPEILEEKEYDPFAADIFSMGVVFCLIYTGVHPFREVTIPLSRNLAIKKTFIINSSRWNARSFGSESFLIARPKLTLTSS